MTHAQSVVDSLSKLNDAKERERERERERETFKSWSTLVQGGNRQKPHSAEQPVRKSSF